MKKFIYILSVLSISLFLFSCDWLFEDTFREENDVSIDSVNYKTSYKSFSELKDPILFSYETRDLAGWKNGNVTIIWDTQTDTMWDWFFTDKTIMYSGEGLLKVKPNADGPVCYCGIGEDYRDFLMINPEKTEPYFYPQTKTSVHTQRFLLSLANPRYLLLSNTSFNQVDNLSCAIINVFDTKEGTISETKGIRTPINYDNSVFFPDTKEECYWFIAKYSKNIKLCKVDSATSTVEETDMFNIDLELLADELGITFDYYGMDEIEENEETEETEEMLFPEFDPFNNYFVNYYVEAVTDSTIYIREELSLPDSSEINLYALNRNDNSTKKVRLDGPEKGYIRYLFSNVFIYNNRVFVLYQGDKQIETGNPYTNYEFGYSIDEVDFNAETPTVNTFFYMLYDRYGGNFNLAGNKLYCVSWNYDNMDLISLNLDTKVLENAGHLSKQTFPTQSEAEK